MPFNQRNMLHGAALWQIATHPEFTAINRPDYTNSHITYIVNDNSDKKLGVYMKYATNPRMPKEPRDTRKDYAFTFDWDSKRDIEKLNERCDETFIILICVKSQEICCLPYSVFRHLLQQRGDSSQTTSSLLVKPQRSFSVNMFPRRRRVGVYGYLLSRGIQIAKKDFPGKLFE